MKLPLRLPSLLLLTALGACNTTKNWSELQVGVMPVATVYDRVQRLAGSFGYSPSTDCDRGLGVYLSRWRSRTSDRGFNHAGRSRLRVEILEPRRGDPEGWLVRWHIERQWVKDLTRSSYPQESDWSNDGQDSEGEVFFGQRLGMLLISAKPPASN